ncbi:MULTISPECIES: lipase family protein [unclassified Pseudomonas]|uniref:lipase family protein n=1 Tax=unclassified Pseudomonas TaxID=196821 RepID=UPI0008765A4A|nr:MULTISPECIES: lipase family protein [unclassified Pseudomonas]SCZ39777.1 Secretory lipase [Pseudomonas sp. NFACC44-2]SDA89624.1 Secretory lipase [Pseudomonas sp. NFACC51]SDW44711.1 Secretory lipase [Pseudomonas sp. NFACC08-1]SFI14852.1 Secretory lipase [Pseudomonas sp. NFACC54]SFT28230.1 Secretory lipase [Pseudomonas sp. NFACC48-1]
MSLFRIMGFARICVGPFILMAANALAAGTLPVGPEAGDRAPSAFYRWPEAMPELPGVLLRSEAFPVQPQMAAAGQALRLLYSSVDERWRSGLVPVSGALYLPVGNPPPHGWPLLAWAHGTLGIADACAPSWTGLRDRDASYINRWLTRGFAVVATDYQGLGGPGPHPYTFWQAEGRSVLDSIRAARSIRPGLIGNHTILAGQSQGGGAALGAAILAGGYAPEVTIQGAVLTAPNSTFPHGPMALAPRQSNMVFLALASGGLREDGPRIEDILTAKGLELLSVARQGCTRDIALKSKALQIGSFAELLTITPDALNAIRIPTTDMPQASIAFPLFIATGLADQTITPVRQYAVAAALCAAGNLVTWRAYEGLGHDGVMHGSLDDVFAFAADQIHGLGSGSNCSALTTPGPPGERDAGAPFNDD